MNAVDSQTNDSVPGIWQGQLIHLFAVLILLPSAGFIWDYLGRTHAILFWTAMAIPMIHQIFVWLAWRLELNRKVISYSIGFKSYLIIFFLLLVLRPVSVVAVAWVEMNSLGLALPLRLALTLICLIPASYLMYSIRKYFSFTRAAGADHFNDTYRHMPLVREGIFKYSSNGMYIFGFLALWAIAIGFDSQLALLVAIFNHLYIWIHYYSTEKPDMEYLYG